MFQPYQLILIVWLPVIFFEIIRILMHKGTPFDHCRNYRKVDIVCTLGFPAIMLFLGIILPGHHPLVHMNLILGIGYYIGWLFCSVSITTGKRDHQCIRQSWTPAATIVYGIYDIELTREAEEKAERDAYMADRDKKVTKQVQRYYPDFLKFSYSQNDLLTLFDFAEAVFDPLDVIRKKGTPDELSEALAIAQAAAAVLYDQFHTMSCLEKTLDKVKTQTDVQAATNSLKLAAASYRMINSSLHL